MTGDSDLLSSTTWVDSACDALAVPLSRGADFSEFYFEDRHETRISSNGSHVIASSTTHMHGVGLYLLCGLESRYGYANDTTPRGLSHLADNLSTLCTWQHATSPAAVAPVKERVFSSPNVIEVAPREVEPARKVRILNEICAQARGFSKHIVEVHADYQDRLQDVAVLNSEGVLARERRIVTTIRLFVTASDGEHTNGAWANFSACRGFEFVEDEQNRAQMVASTCSTAIDGLAARPVAPEVMPVVVDSGTFVHEDCGHPLESTAGSTSIFFGKVGEQVASPLVTIADSGAIEGLCGSNAMSDEGVPSAENVLIEDGVLRGYMIDRLGSRQLGMPMTAAGRRQDYRFAPVARMTNTYMRCGSTPTEDIIPSVDHGLYVREVGGGNVDPTTGRFNFLAASGNLIEHGELTYPISNINLSGDSIDALKRISVVGDKYFPDSGSLCGAGSGLIYVTAFMPRILIDGMMVG